MDRTVTHCARLVAVILAAGLAGASPARAQVKVSGTTLTIDPAGTYSELKMVAIKATRGGGSVFNAPRYSDANGHFEFDVPAGEPFSLLFYGGGKVPEVQQLAGRGGLGHHVHVTLMPPDQYVRAYGREALVTQKARVLAAVENDPETAAQLRRIFEELRLP